MSTHKKPLTELERSGLAVTGLPIGAPSQLSDAFRLGVAHAISEYGNLVEQNKALKAALLDAKGFAELIQIIGTTDCEIYKHELRGDSDLAITRIDKALEKVDVNN